MLKRIGLWLKRRATKRRAEKMQLDSPSIVRVQEVWMGRKNGRLVTVESLPVGRYLAILPKLDQIPAVLMKSAQYRQSPVEFLTAAADVVKDEFISIIEEASGLDRAFLINEVSAAELTRFLVALHEVNEFSFIAGELKKQMGGMFEEAKRLISMQDNGNG